MEKKQNKKAPAPKKKTASPKKKVTKKANLEEISILAPETTPFVAHHEDSKPEPKVSFLDKIKKFLGF
jgi:hypothetical protein